MPFASKWDVKALFNRPTIYIALPGGAGRVANTTHCDRSYQERMQPIRLTCQLLFNSAKMAGTSMAPGLNKSLQVAETKNNDNFISGQVNQKSGHLLLLSFVI